MTDLSQRLLAQYGGLRGLFRMAAPEQEQLRVVLLDTKHRILGTRTPYQGSVNQRRWPAGHLKNTTYNSCSF